MSDNRIQGIDTQDSGWKYWAQLVLNNITSLSKDLEDLEIRLNQITCNLQSELNSNKSHINTINLALEEFKRVNDEIKRIRVDLQELKELKEKISNLKEDVASLKVKASGWGAISGLLTAVAAGLIYFLIKLRQ